MVRYVILRDDDTNALTPPEYLERLYRPFLQHGLPVNLAVIPNVRTDVTYGQNILEGFLLMRNGTREKMRSIGSNHELVDYLHENRGFHVVQHGYNHEFVNGDCEFEQHHRRDLIRRLDEGAQHLVEAGFARPETFVAPYDRFTRISFSEVARRFQIISTAWFELRRLPYRWWPLFVFSKATKRSHWRAGQTILLSHPRCYLSCRRPYGTMFDEIVQALTGRPLTVLVTHWWEFFQGGQPDEAFIRVLHKVADYLATTPDIQVVSFREVARGRVPLN